MPRGLRLYDFLVFAGTSAQRKVQHSFYLFVHFLSGRDILGFLSYKQTQGAESMAAFYESYPHNTLFAAMWYLVISAVEGGTMTGWKNMKRDLMASTFWSAISFTAKQ